MSARAGWPVRARCSGAARWPGPAAASEPRLHPSTPLPATALPQGDQFGHCLLLHAHSLVTRCALLHPPPPATAPPQGDQFGYCPPWALAWPYRRLNLLKELLAYDADIMCLQEVQSNHFQVGGRRRALVGAGGCWRGGCWPVMPAARACRRCRAAISR